MYAAGGGFNNEELTTLSTKALQDANRAREVLSRRCVGIVERLIHCGIGGALWRVETPNVMSDGLVRRESLVPDRCIERIALHDGNER